MKKKDKIKLLVLAILVTVMSMTYFLYGKESMVMKIVVGSSFLCWLVTMFYSNRKFKE